MAYVKLYINDKHWIIICIIIIIIINDESNNHRVAVD